MLYEAHVLKRNLMSTGGFTQPELSPCIYKIKSSLVCSVKITGNCALTRDALGCQNEDGEEEEGVPNEAFAVDRTWLPDGKI